MPHAKTYSDGLIQASTSECVGIFGVKHNLHYVMSVTLKSLGTSPVLVPVPQFNHHVVRGGQDKGLCRVN